MNAWYTADHVPLSIGMSVWIYDADDDSIRSKTVAGVSLNGCRVTFDTPTPSGKIGYRVNGIFFHADGAADVRRRWLEELKKAEKSE